MKFLDFRIVRMVMVLEVAPAFVGGGAMPCQGAGVEYRGLLAGCGV